MEQQTCSKLGKEYIMVIYCHPAYFYMQSSSCEMLGGVKHKHLEFHLVEAQAAGIKIARRNINNLRYADDTILMA